MKNLVHILFLLFFSFSIKAQNLVTNPGFEEIDSCYGSPAAIGFDVFQWSGCKGWSNPIAASSDLWCKNPIIGNNFPPQLGPNYQYPHTGENMAGILINSGGLYNYREYVQNELILQLEANCLYRVEFYISANGNQCYSNQYGLKFSHTKYYNSSQLWLTDLIPDIVNDESDFSNDTSIWQKISMEYIADGTEKYFILGNFQDSLSMTYTMPCDTSFWGGLTLGGGYFFIDDVQIEKAPPTTNIPNVFTPNDDGVNDLFTPQIFNIENWEMLIFNRWGNKVISLNDNFPYWDGKDCDDGVYFYKLRNTIYDFEQGFISIIRNKL